MAPSPRPGADDRPPELSAAGFGARADISARSVLVTIFGDSVVPAGGEIWLADLIDLCQPFGFSDRLVRTSLFRLGAEGWFETDRVGRRSRYRLSPWAMDEFARAEHRIYGVPATGSDARPWDGTWTVALVGAAPIDPSGSEALRAALTAHGFAALAPGVMASPRAEPAEVTQLASRLGVAGPVPVATARFEELETLVAAGWLRDGFDLSTLIGRYRSFLHRYGPLHAIPIDDLDDEEAFAVRTMVVHDLRRARLVDPDLPGEILGVDWPGGPAWDLAATIYPQVAPGAERWLAKITGLSVDQARSATRFR